METELPIHETTGLQALGYTSKGKPIWPILGGSGEGGDGGSGGGNEGGQQGSQGSGENGNGDGNSNDPDEITPDNTDAKKANEAANKWRARADKDKAAAQAAQAQLADLQSKTQKQLDDIAIALGLKKEEATPEQLQKALNESTEKVSAAEAAAKGAQIELGVFKAAAKVDGADPADLLDRISFMKKAGELDPKSDKFLTDMEKLIRENTKTGSGGGFSAPVGGGAPQGGAGNNETDPRKLADRISRSGGGIRSL